jgi:hypothetical protein
MLVMVAENLDYHHKPEASIKMAAHMERMGDSND